MKTKIWIINDIPFYIVLNPAYNTGSMDCKYTICRGFKDTYAVRNTGYGVSSKREFTKTLCKKIYHEMQAERRI